MKNKDKYNLKDLSVILNWNINGCGRKIEDSREIIIKKNDEVIHQKRTQENIICYVFDWLEKEK